MGGPEENDLKNDLLKMLKYPGHKIFRVFFWVHTGTRTKAQAQADACAICAIKAVWEFSMKTWNTCLQVFMEIKTGNQYEKQD